MRISVLFLLAFAPFATSCCCSQVGPVHRCYIVTDSSLVPESPAAIDPQAVN